MAKPYFSIIIPTLNEEKSLPLLLKDLASQTYKNFEVIISDGNSEDKTINKAKKFNKKLKLTTTITKIRHVSVQRNNGAKKTQGEYLIFMDADNRLPPYFLEGLYYRILIQKPDIFTTWCKEDKNTKADKAIATLINLTIETTYLINSPRALGALIGCKKHIFNKTSGFNPQTTFAEDGEFVKHCHNLGFNCQIFHDPRFTVSLRRFRKNGKIKSLQKYASLHIKKILQLKINNNEYPMGGKAFETDDSTQNLFQKIKFASSKLAQKPKIAAKIRHLLQVILDQNQLP